jgi:hypothetical protein
MFAMAALFAGRWTPVGCFVSQRPVHLRRRHHSSTTSSFAHHCCFALRGQDPSWSLQARLWPRDPDARPLLISLGLLLADHPLKESSLGVATSVR